MESKEIYDQVNRRYGSIIQSSTRQYEQTVARAFGYTEDELSGVPEGANLGLGCGNPVAIAGLREGETVIDLGCGAGLDVFTAANRVGPAGKAIGVDMNPNMINKANANKARINDLNVNFLESTITSIALPSNTAHCIISNCVINLVPPEEKQDVFSEMFRLLKPGGRVAISDILGRKKFTEDIRKNIALYVGCIAGASQVSEYEAFLKNVGFSDILIVDSKNDLNVYSTAAAAQSPCCATNPVKGEAEEPSCCTAEVKESCCESEGKAACCGTDLSKCACQEMLSSIAAEASTGTSRLGITDFNEWAGSFQVYAVKPGAD